MGEHKTPYLIPWWYWAIRFDFVEHYRRQFETRGHSSSMALALATMTAAHVWSLPWWVRR